MTPSSTVLVSLRSRPREGAGLRDELDGMIRRCGYRPHFTRGGRETLDSVRRDSFVASFLDSGYWGQGSDDTELVDGEAVWRVVRRIVGRRLVLMTRAPRNDFWFDALRAGVGTVLPLPPQEPTVRAALQAVAGAGPANRADA